MTMTAKRKPSRVGGPIADGKFSGAETWVVTGATASDNQSTVCACADIPQVGTSLYGGVVSRLSARETENVGVWEVDVSLDSAAGSTAKDPGNQQQNPVLRYPDVSYGVNRVSKALWHDLNENPIANSAGDLFDPPEEDEVIHPTITITRYEPYSVIISDLQQRYINHINSDEFLGHPAGNVRCTNITGANYYENGYTCLKITYSFEMAPEGWDLRLLDRGGMYWMHPPGSATLTRKKVLAKDGNNVAHGGLVLLDGNGELLNGTGAWIEGGDDPVYLPFKKFNRRTFSALNIEL